ncbi:MAG: NAD(P)/FAD-dependent oxidoreductase [Candidatus Woesearchaeota archaeon]
MAGKIVIIGGGPVGSYLAFLLGKKFDVTVFEQGEIGEPVQCTGIVTRDIDSIKALRAERKKATVNTIRKARIHSPHEKMDLTLRSNHIIDRAVFDRAIARKAKNAGAHYIHERVRKVSDNSITTTKEYTADMIIGADGPGSIVRRRIDPRKIRMRQGIQARVRSRNDNNVEFFPYIGDYAWAVPEDKEVMRIGCIGNKRVFRKFLKRFDGDILEYQGGMIPDHDPRLRTQSGNLYIAGDAAAQVKATTGGGLVPGLQAAECLAEAIIEGGDYERLWRKRLGRNLWAHLMIRRMLDRFSERDFDRLIRLTRQKRIRKIIEESDRERPVEYLMKLLLYEPRYLYFTKTFLI